MGDSKLFLNASGETPNGSNAFGSTSRQFGNKLPDRNCYMLSRL
jgi:hypothetical protein